MEATLGLVGPFSFGRGWPQLRTLAPVAGNEPARFVVPGGRVQRVVAVACKLVTNAEVFERFVRVNFADSDGNVWSRCPAGTKIEKELTRFFSWNIENVWQNALHGNVGLGGLPDARLTGGMVVSVEILNGQAGDAVSQIFLMVEEFPNGPDGYPTGVQEVAPAWNVQ